ncbi:hypothetical protein LR48_Vigan07g233300 [Vigna angularis]|uniref:Uncharacterized protein n=1 Tax=Phaseolus angularis TaxID=3914 RepID=A0A0L9V1K2_PHAAN|nr:hypothetical protein LR48_Vigan07g233300 [Vigna angularis]
MRPSARLGAYVAQMGRTSVLPGDRVEDRPPNEGPGDRIEDRPPNEVPGDRVEDRPPNLVPESSIGKTDAHITLTGQITNHCGSSKLTWFRGLHPSGSRGKSKIEKKIRRWDKIAGELEGLEQHSPTHPKHRWDKIAGELEGLEQHSPTHPKHLAPTVGPCDFKNPMVTTRNMSMDDPVEIMRVLQQKMDEMQQRHEEEMVAVKADCEARIAREVGRIDGRERVKDKGKEVVGDRPPPDTECDKTWRPSGSEAEGSKAKSVHAESVAEDGRATA